MKRLSGFGGIEGGMRQLIAGNWKMHGLSAALAEISALAAEAQARPFGCDVMICPPATLTGRAAAAAKGLLFIGGQDCHAEIQGAHTGDISAEMLADAGASAVIVGHSECRHDHGETDAAVAAKVRAAHRAGLLAIMCIGESEAERDAGQALIAAGRQLQASLPDGMAAHAIAATTVIAYEPVWAIGTGRTPTADQIAQMHGFIRERLAVRFAGQGSAMRILYGGSVKPANAADILAIADVGGALVGGASLKAAEFAQIARAAQAEG